MKGSQKVLELLNKALADELAAINQYMVHSEMCHNWGYDFLHKEIEKRAINEMKHAEKLIERILFLEGNPIVSKLSPIKIGETVEKMMEYDLNAELGAVKDYNEFAKICVDENDNVSKDLFEELLKDEEGHVDWIENQIEQIKQMGLGVYLLKATKA